MRVYTPPRSAEDTRNPLEIADLGMELSFVPNCPYVLPYMGSFPTNKLAAIAPPTGYLPSPHPSTRFRIPSEQLLSLNYGIGD
jgi:hypothetical protein